MNNIDLIDKLHRDRHLGGRDLLQLISTVDDDELLYINKIARDVRRRSYGDSVFMRGLIEFTNYCKQNCLYCGLRAGNRDAQRYRLTPEQILAVCGQGYSLGLRTFVLQGGEDDYFTDDLMVEIIRMIRSKFPDCAITLSIGEKSRESYLRYYNAGANRYLLRHETASEELFSSLHPNHEFESRRQCLIHLKEIGFQVGAGFMVGLPNQTNDDLVKDILFLRELSPHMIGIGPFVPHRSTPLASSNAGTVQQVMLMLSILRLMLPDVLLPATTALGAVDNSHGQILALNAGANVVMPNLTPTDQRSKYLLYDGKVFVSDRVSDGLDFMVQRIESIGLIPDMSRGDHRNFNNSHSIY